jgi:hypothetical protein
MSIMASQTKLQQAKKKEALHPANSINRRSSKPETKTKTVASVRASALVYYQNEHYGGKKAATTKQKTTAISWYTGISWYTMSIMACFIVQSHSISNSNKQSR